MYYWLLCHNPWKVENGKKCRLDPFGTAQSILWRPPTYSLLTYIIDFTCSVFITSNTVMAHIFWSGWFFCLCMSGTLSRTISGIQTLLQTTSSACWNENIFVFSVSVQLAHLIRYDDTFYKFTFYFYLLVVHKVMDQCWWNFQVGSNCTRTVWVNSEQWVNNLNFGSGKPHILARFWMKSCQTILME